MKKLFLTSSVHTVAHDIAKRVDLKKENKLVFIDTAAEVVEGDKNWLKKDRFSLIESGFVVENYTLTGKTKEQLERDLFKFDYIYLSGGDTPHLLQQSQKSGFIPLIKTLILENGKTYIGTSAGSIIAGPTVPPYLYEESKIPNETKRQGYGFVNFTIVAHWGDKFFKDRYLKTRLKMVYRKSQNPLLLLTNNQYVYINDDCVKIIDITKS